MSPSYRGVGGQGRGVLGLLAGITGSACPAATPPNLKESGGHDDFSVIALHVTWSRLL